MNYLITKTTAMNKARYKHDCNHCVYLGHFDKYDLYVCPKHNTKTISTVVARFGIDGDYNSGVTCIYKYDWATQAYNKALTKGYSLSKDDKKYVWNTQTNIPIHNEIIKQVIKKQARQNLKDMMKSWDNEMDIDQDQHMQPRSDNHE